ncbi:hypothetical protein BH10PSE1_BH10PSE1_11170 [soil metagenome]
MSVERIRLGIPFNFDEGWIGGSYYILNLVSALGLLPESQQPDVVMISNDVSSFDFIRDGSRYPRLYWATSAQMTAQAGTYGVDVLFPHPMPGQEQRTLSWIPDFQDKRYPEFFSDEELGNRTTWHLQCLATGGVVFSSEAVARDAQEAYPDVAIRGHVVPFATFNRDKPSDFYAVRDALALPDEYFYCPNQFWKHKNHKVVISAVGELRERGLNPVICFSGKEFEPRFPEHVNELKAQVVELGLENNIRFLGFLDRSDQLEVFKHAQAVIQPSLSEGWSTVIEDAKWAGRFVIASDIEVHREQLSVNYALFDGLNPTSLANTLETFLQAPPRLALLDYKAAQRSFAKRFMQAITAVAAANGPGQTLAARPTMGPDSRDSRRREREMSILGLQTDLNVRSARAERARVLYEVEKLASDEVQTNLEAALVQSRDVPVAISTTLSANEIGGLGFEELAIPEHGIDGNFYWIEGRCLIIRPRQELMKDPVLTIEYRNIVPHQTLEVQVGVEPVQLRLVPENGLSDRGKTEFILGQGLRRLTEIRVEVGQVSSGNGRALGLLVTRLDLQGTIPKTTITTLTGRSNHSVPT